MLWFILGIVGGVMMVVAFFVCFVVYHYAKAAEQAYKEGWDNPNL